MKQTRTPVSRLISHLPIALIAAVLLLAPATAMADEQLAVDVACNANSFVFQGPSTAAGPAAGASFVVQGVIYPAGTLAAHGSSSGLNADGTPEFPELVIGTWTCQGHFIGEGFAAQGGPFVATTQLFDLDTRTPGKKTLVTHGIELIDLNKAFRRAVTGGTGQFDRAVGQSTQKAVGVNATGLFNFTFNFQLR